MTNELVESNFTILPPFSVPGFVVESSVLPPIVIVLLVTSANMVLSSSTPANILVFTCKLPPVITFEVDPPTRYIIIN